MIAYKITNRINGKSYVGITTNPTLQRRWYSHRFHENSSGKLIHKAIKKHGEENFTIEQIASAIGSLENLKLVEKELIKQLETKVPNGYNLTDGGDGVFGYKHSKESIEKRKAKMVGYTHSEETLQKMSNAHSGENNHFYGKTHTEETKRKNAEAHKKGIIIAKNIQTNEQFFLDGVQDIKKYKFNPSHVYECISGKAKTHKGFTFKRI
jgi:group I intron endonuclease